MFNNINDNNNFLYNSGLEKQENIIKLAPTKLNPVTNPYSKVQSHYVDKTEISLDAIKLFERDCDIKKFNNIALSNPEDNSHLERMKELFADGVVDAFEDDVFAELLNSSKLLDDLGL
ncbi:hypothetical protein IJO12_04895 [bacterium]|nr:hypothetical protein [bacterium]